MWRWWWMLGMWNNINLSVETFKFLFHPKNGLLLHENYLTTTWYYILENNTIYTSSLFTSPNYSDRLWRMKQIEMEKKQNFSLSFHHLASKCIIFILILVFFFLNKCILIFFLIQQSTWGLLVNRVLLKKKWIPANWFAYGSLDEP